MAGRVSITFDDGLVSVYSLAFPEMEALGIRGTVFVPSDLVGRQFLDHPVMSEAMMRGLCSAGWEIGSHTRTHPRLTDLSGREADEELRLSKSHLESLVGRRVTSFAYPYGGSGFDRRITHIAARYYTCARTLSCYPPLRLNQTTPSDRMTLRAMGSREPAFMLPLHLYSIHAPETAKRALHRLSNRSRGVQGGVSSSRTSLDGSTIEKWVQRSARRGQWLILCFHNISSERTSTSYTVAVSGFRRILRAVAAGPEVTTLGEVFQEAEP